MASLAEELSQLANPSPKFHDPEDDIHDETSAHVVSSQIKADSDDDTPVEELTSKFRRQTVPLLSDTDIKYQGKTTSRKSLLADDLSDEYEGPQASDDGSEESSEEGDNSSSEDVEGDISVFKQQIKLNSAALKEKYLDDNDDNISDDTMEEGTSDDSQGENNDDQNSDEDSGVEEDGANEGVSKFSKTDFSEEIEKGKAVKNQITLWESLLEGRIKLQKSLSLVNQLPHPEQWPEFASEGGDNFTECSTECHQAVKTLLDSLTYLQTLLLLNNPETKSVVQGRDSEGSSSLSKAEDDVDNEEITSESEVEEDTPVKSGKSPPGSSKKPLKRKLRIDEYPDILAKRHTDFHTYRNNTIQKWGEKTRLAAGKLKNKSFSAFEQSAVKQIEQIMTDKNRLIKRTQLKRSVYKVLGKEEFLDQGEATGDNPESNQIDSKKQEDQNHDEEIFDDDDFYHQLLRELIERKTSDITDPVALSRQWLEIQRLRTKVKKKVDTKASKGRKLRYDIHKKLVNFMAPVDYSTWTDEARDDLYRSLFGKIFIQATAEER